MVLSPCPGSRSPERYRRTYIVPQTQKVVENVRKVKETCGRRHDAFQFQSKDRELYS